MLSSLIPANGGGRKMECLLNLQIIYERIQAIDPEAEFAPPSEMPGLKGICFYEGEQEKKEFLVICSREHSNQLPDSGSLLLLGDWGEEERAGLAGYILKRDGDLFSLLNELERLFFYYGEIEKRLQRILYADSSLNDICQIILEHFGRSVFVHDEHFYILSCPQMEPEKTKFDYDSQMGSFMQDKQTLTMFRTSPAYQETLKTRGGQFWKSDFDDNNCLYVNIWIDQIYKGRLIVTESLPTPGKLREVGYFGEIIRQAFINRYVYRDDVPSLLKGILVDGLKGREINAAKLSQKARQMGWQMEDHYVCGIITFGNEKISHYLAFGVCNSIQQQIEGSYPCYYDRAIYLLVNLTKGNLSLSDLRMKMSYTIRESLLHVGISNIFYRLQDFPLYMKQARIALVHSQEENRTSWYNEFKDNVLSYWMINGLGEMTRDTIISGDLGVLKNYDREKGTDLYQTLKVYLIHERNSTLTAQILKIHRSTLPHRLERIERLTGMNLDDFKTRLYLLMSFALEE